MDDAHAALAHAIERVLPQTQCAACGFAGCAPFADALARGTTALTGCVPGGALLVAKLSRLLERVGGPRVNLCAETALPAPLRVQIRAEACIGCTKCIAVCPVDAIIGAPRQLHDILTEHCTGCGLCIPPCPTNCIDWVSVAPGFAWPLAAAPAALAIQTQTDITHCTGCGDCGPVCPSQLAPAPLASAVAQGDLDRAVTLGLERCAACGQCGAACPVGIPLPAYFVQGRSVLAAARWQTEQAAGAGQRATQRRQRLARSATQNREPYVLAPSDPAQARDDITAARSRVRQRKASPAQPPA
ncbi:MAG: RnfABCDGE type electron transport complex subunit B [Gammaproteobacteria bacterium]|nr:RnfABCDGE type electron transport complex subunit B [Gammaproteobacteria bacterium]